MISVKVSLMNQRQSYFCLCPFFFISTIQWRAEEKHKAKPKHQIRGSKMKPYGFSLHFHLCYFSFCVEGLLRLLCRRNNRLTIRTINLMKHTVHVWKCLINNNINNNILTKVLLISDLGQFVFPKCCGLSVGVSVICFRTI